jgi:hypothetical protein
MNHVHMSISIPIMFTANEVPFLPLFFRLSKKHTSSPRPEFKSIAPWCSAAPEKTTLSLGLSAPCQLSWMDTCQAISGKVLFLHWQCHGTYGERSVKCYDACIVGDSRLWADVVQGTGPGAHTSMLKNDSDISSEVSFSKQSLEQQWERASHCCLQIDICKESL